MSEIQPRFGSLKFSDASHQKYPVKTYFWAKHFDKVFHRALTDYLMTK